MNAGDTAVLKSVRKDVRIDLRVTPETKLGWEQAARLDGMGLTEWLSRMADTEAAKAYWRARRMEIARTTLDRTEPV